MTDAVTCDDGRRFAFDTGSTALMVIDMQRDFLDPDGMCGQWGEDISGLRAIVPAVGRLLDRARGAGIRVIHSRESYAADLSDVHPLKLERGGVGTAGPLGRFLIQGEAGHDFIPELRPLAGETVIDKPGFGAFYRTDLEQILLGAGITHLVLSGVTTQCCVQSTMREAVDRGFYCLTLADACAAIDVKMHDAAIALIRGEDNLFGWVATTDAFQAALD